MRIGKVVRLTGLTKDTIRFYEKRGLIQPKGSESEWNNYKEYDENLVQKLELIKKAKSFGFTLNEIQDLFNLLSHEGASCAFWEEQLGLKLQEIDQKVRELNEMKSEILWKADLIRGQCGQSRVDKICREIRLPETL